MISENYLSTIESSMREISCLWTLLLHRH